MKLSITKEDLLPALQTVNTVVERRQSLPILSNLLFSSSSKQITITATDMEVELIASIQVNNLPDIEVTLPARKLFDICRALPDKATLSMDISEDRAILISGKSRFTLSTLPAKEYPLIDMQDPVLEFTISQKGFKDLMEKTAFAMAQQDVRYYLNGLLLEFKQNSLRAVATDGHRLALYDIENTINFEEKLQIIVPRKGVMELIRLLEDSGDVTVQITSNHIRVSFLNLTFTSKLIDGKFPDYDRVIPEKGKSTIIADRELLKQSLMRASILSNEKYRGVRILLGKGRLRALTRNHEQEEAEEEVDVEYDGPDIEIGFNVSYLLDALGIIKTKKVKIAIENPDSSCLLLPEDNSNSKYVVMPMRL